MNDAIRIYTNAYSLLERGFSAIRDHPGVELPLALKNAKHRCLAAGSSATFAPHPFCAEVGLVDLHFPLEGGRGLAELSDPLADES